MRATVILAALALTPLGDAEAQVRAQILAQVAQESSASPEVSDHGAAWFGIGLTAGSVSGAEPFSDFAVAFSLNLRAGGTASPHLRFAGELDLCLAWDVGDHSGVLVTPALTASVYPKADAGFFLKAGLGVQYFQTLEYADWNATALAVIAGFGYDLRFGGPFSVTPFAQVAMQASLLAPSSADEGEWMMTQGQLGVSFVWH